MRLDLERVGPKLLEPRLAAPKLTRTWLRVPAPGTTLELAPRIVVRQNLARVVRYWSSKAIYSSC